MDSATLELTLCQLRKVSEASKTNHHVYSDKRKVNFHKEIEELLLKIKDTDFSSLSEGEKLIHKELFEILFAWLEFLDNSTLNNIPFEIVWCLQVVLEEWLEAEDYKKFVIVTSLQSHLSFFYYDLELGSLTSYVKGTYGRDITNTLVPINLPKYLVHDYLANVTLYHEVGHFIDRHYKISRRIVDSDPLFSAKSDEEREMQFNHLSEFFADIFAAQYIDEKCSLYLNHIAHNHPESFTHPATARRVDVVNSFLKGADDKIIKIITESTKKITGQELKPKRYNVVNENHFEEYLPAEIDDKSQLHFLFIQGWISWYNLKGNIRSKFDAQDSYRIINNLIEKSISNFIVSEKWKEANVPDKK